MPSSAFKGSWHFGQANARATLRSARQLGQDDSVPSRGKLHLRQTNRPVFATELAWNFFSWSSRSSMAPSTVSSPGRVPTFGASLMISKWQNGHAAVPGATSSPQKGHGLLGNFAPHLGHKVSCGATVTPHSGHVRVESVAVMVFPWSRLVLRSSAESILCVAQHARLPSLVLAGGVRGYAELLEVIIDVSGILTGAGTVLTRDIDRRGFEIDLLLDDAEQSVSRRPSLTGSFSWSEPDDRR